MDHWGIYLRLNLQEHWCQNSWKSLLIIVPKMGAGPIYRKTLSHGVAVFGGKVSHVQPACLISPCIHVNHALLHLDKLASSS